MHEQLAILNSQQQQQQISMELKVIRAKRELRSPGLWQTIKGKYVFLKPSKPALGYGHLSVSEVNIRVFQYKDSKSAAEKGFAETRKE